jgi:hypothetical protein
LTEFAKRNLDELTRAQEEMDAAVEGANLSDRELLESYNQRLLDIEQEKNRKIAEQAAMLTSFKPFLV